MVGERGREVRAREGRMNGGDGGMGGTVMPKAIADIIAGPSHSSNIFRSHKQKFF